MGIGLVWTGLHAQSLCCPSEETSTCTPESPKWSPSPAAVHCWLQLQPHTQIRSVDQALNGRAVHSDIRDRILDRLGPDATLLLAILSVSPETGRNSECMGIGLVGIKAVWIERHMAEERRIADTALHIVDAPDGVFTHGNLIRMAIRAGGVIRLSAQCRVQLFRRVMLRRGLPWCRLL